MTLSEHDRVLTHLTAAFESSNVKPASLFRCYLKKYEEEFIYLDELDWLRVKPCDLEKTYEANTFISNQGFRYLFPHVFRLVCTYPQESLSLDFVAVFFQLPVLSSRAKIFDELTLFECRAVWSSYQYLVETLGFDEFVDWPEESRKIKYLLRIK